jgi:aryl-alcohol dehydrogenase-like predicted oxidoreductase
MTPIETRSIGADGPSLPLVGLGCNNFGWRIDRAATERVIDRALELGVTHLDTADIYGGGGKSEEFIGELIGKRRSAVFIATKFGKMPDAVAGVRGTRRYIRKAVDASLKRLRIEAIDLYYMHEPDPKTPIEETLGALDELTRAGKIRQAGCSNFSADQVEEAATAAKSLGVRGFVASQDEYSLVNRSIEAARLPTLRMHGIALIPFYPLAGGALTGKYRRGAPLPKGARHADGSARFLDPHWDRIERLRGFAEARGHSLLELAFSWLAQRPQVVSIIAGATSPDQLNANAKAVGWRLSADEMSEVDRITAV